MSSVSMSRISSISTSMASLCEQRHKKLLFKILNGKSWVDFTYRWIKELLQLIVKPHLDSQSLPDQAHLMWTVFGGKKLFPTLLDLCPLFIEIHAQICSIWRTFAVIHLFQTALHFPSCCFRHSCCCWMFFIIN